MNELIFKIKNWDEYFEIAESRRHKKNRWLPLPNRHDDLQFIKISKHPKKFEIFTCWILLLQIASKMPERGLLKDTHGPLNFEDFELLTGFPSKSFQLAIDFLKLPEIGWIEQLGHTQSAPRERSERATTTLHYSTRQKEKSTKKKIVKSESSIKNFLESLKTIFPKLQDQEFFDLFAGHCLEKNTNVSERAIRMRLKSLNPYLIGWCKTRIRNAIDLGWKGLVFDDDKPETPPSGKNTDLEVRIFRAKDTFLKMCAHPENYTKEQYERCLEFLKVHNSVPGHTEINPESFKRDGAVPNTVEKKKPSELLYEAVREK